MGHCDSNRKISVSDLLNRENHIFLKEYGAIDENGLMSLDLYNKNVVKNDILDCFNISVDSPYLFHEKKKSSDNPKKDPISWTRLNIYKFVLMISYKVNSTT